MKTTARLIVELQELKAMDYKDGWFPAAEKLMDETIAFLQKSGEAGGRLRALVAAARIEALHDAQCAVVEACQACDGQGFTIGVTTGYGHACNGDERECQRMCPVPVPEQTQEPCEYCGRPSAAILALLSAPVGSPPQEKRWGKCGNCGGREFQVIEQCTECQESEILDRFETTGELPASAPRGGGETRPTIEAAIRGLDELRAKMAAMGIVPPCPACVSEIGRVDPECIHCHGTGRGDVQEKP